jgi:hypothetical protein
MIPRISYVRLETALADSQKRCHLNVLLASSVPLSECSWLYSCVVSSDRLSLRYHVSSSPGAQMNIHKSTTFLRPRWGLLHHTQEGPRNIKFRQYCSELHVSVRKNVLWFPIFVKCFMSSSVTGHLSPLVLSVIDSTSSWCEPLMWEFQQFHWK